MPFWYRGTRDILSYIPACAVPWKGTHRFAMFCMVYPFNPNNPCSFCHLELVERSLFNLSFSRSLREKDQKRGATPKAPYIGGCKRESRTTDDSRASLASRDTRYSFLHPCCRRPLERDSQVGYCCFFLLSWRNK